MAVLGFFLILSMEWIFPNVIPFTTFQFWRVTGTVGEIWESSWVAFAWGGGITLLVAASTRNDWRMNLHAERYMKSGFWVSVWAGIAEEVSFRWIFFYLLIVWIKAINWLIFGWAGLGVLEWLFTKVFGPIANFFTLGKLSPYLFGGGGWAAGSAILGANGAFRDGHKYLGFVGFVNSWFMGMFFFYLMFRYGLLASIVVHFLYDLLIFAVRYIDAVVERARGYGVPTAKDLLDDSVHGRY